MEGEGQSATCPCTSASSSASFSSYCWDWGSNRGRRESRVESRGREGEGADPLESFRVPKANTQLPSPSPCSAPGIYQPNSKELSVILDQTLIHFLGGRWGGGLGASVSSPRYLVVPKANSSL